MPPTTNHSLEILFSIKVTTPYEEQNNQIEYSLRPMVNEKYERIEKRIDAQSNHHFRYVLLNYTVEAFPSFNHTFIILFLYDNQRSTT
jgi:hypothetical protein